MLGRPEGNNRVKTDGLGQHRVALHYDSTSPCSNGCTGCDNAAFAEIPISCSKRLLRRWKFYLGIEISRLSFWVATRSRLCSSIHRCDTLRRYFQKISRDQFSLVAGDLCRENMIANKVKMDFSITCFQSGRDQDRNIHILLLSPNVPISGCQRAARSSWQIPHGSYSHEGAFYATSLRLP